MLFNSYTRFFHHVDLLWFIRLKCDLVIENITKTENLRYIQNSKVSAAFKRGSLAGEIKFK